MKILIVGIVPPNPADIKGGVQAVTLNLLDGLRSVPGIEVSVFSLNKEIRKPFSLLYSPHIRIFYFPFGKTRSTKWEMLFHGRRRLKHLVENFQPDVVHFQESGSLLLLSPGLDKKNVVITSHGILREEIKYQKSIKRTLNHFVVILIEKFLLKRFHNIIFISRYSKNYYLKKRLVNPKKALWRIVHNPVSSRFFASPTHDFSSLKLQEKPDRTIFVYVGRLIPLKGIDVLIRSLEKAHRKGLDFELRIIGGWASSRYERKISKIMSGAGMADKIRFLGWQDQEGVVAGLREASVFVLPSKQENLPISVAEALSVGKIVVASRVGGIGEMITDKENGLLFDKEDIPALEKIILDILEGRVDRVSLSQNAKKRAVQIFHPDSVAKQTVDFYKAVAGSVTAPSSLGIKA